jgi:hypothetical protein
MGMVYDTIASKGWIQGKPAGEAIIATAIKNTGVEASGESVNELTKEEAQLIALKLDRLAPAEMNLITARMCARNYETICTMVQRVKHETSGVFRGMKSVGNDLDLMWLLPQMVGATNFMNKAGTGSLGLYTGTSGAVYVWEHSFTTAGTDEDIIPSQQMAEECAMLHMGISDTMGIPKVEFIEFTIEGQPMPDQGLQQLKQAYKPYKQSAVTLEFEYPVYVGPETTQLIELEPMVSSGADAVQLDSLIVYMAKVAAL